MASSGELGLVLLPGLDGTGRLFLPLLETLPATFDVQVLRYPPDRPLSYPELLKYVLSRLSSSADQPIVLCAESFSGPLAIDLACTGPLNVQLNVKGVIFCATFARSPRPRLLNLGRLLPLSGLLRLPIPEWVVKALLLGDDVEDSMVRLFFQNLSEVRAGALARRLREVAMVDRTSKLSAIRVPCCYLRATRDRMVPARCLTDFQDHIPGLRVNEIEGPHMILQAKPKACSGVILDFMKHCVG